jgi:hypothetical protein
MTGDAAIEFLLRVSGGRWDVALIPHVGGEVLPYAAAMFANKQHEDGLGYGYLFALGTKDLTQICEFHCRFHLTKGEPKIPTWDGKQLTFPAGDAWIMRKVIVDPIVDLAPALFRQAIDIVGWPLDKLEKPTPYSG